MEVAVRTARRKRLAAVGEAKEARRAAKDALALQAEVARLHKLLAGASVGPLPARPNGYIQHMAEPPAGQPRDAHTTTDIPAPRNARHASWSRSAPSAALKSGDKGTRLSVAQDQ